MFIRFVVNQRDEDSHQQQGVFQPAFELRDRLDVADYHREQLAEILRWFDDNLELPERFSKSKRTTDGRAISWYRDSATEQIARMRELGAIVAEYGYAMDELKTTRPGVIVWQDEHQIVAEPFKDTF